MIAIPKEVGLGLLFLRSLCLGMSNKHDVLRTTTLTLDWLDQLHFRSANRHPSYRSTMWVSSAQPQSISCSVSFGGFLCASFRKLCHLHPKRQHCLARKKKYYYSLSLGIIKSAFRNKFYLTDWAQGDNNPRVWGQQVYQDLHRRLRTFSNCITLSVFSCHSGYGKPFFWGFT